MYVLNECKCEKKKHVILWACGCVTKHIIWSEKIKISVKCMVCQKWCKELLEINTNFY